MSTNVTRPVLEAPIALEDDTLDSTSDRWDDPATVFDLAEVDVLEDDQWGTVSYFARMAGVDRTTAGYWLDTVHRPAHRTAHPLLNIDGCPGCVYETAVAA